MEVRAARLDDASEVVRLAGLMYESMGVPAGPDWSVRAEEQYRARLGQDLVAYVVDDPERPGGLCASGCGVIQPRLVSPSNPLRLVGYIQWVCTDAHARRHGHSTRVIIALLEWFDGRSVSVVELHATADGEPVYRRLGFGDNGGVALRRTAWD